MGTRAGSISALTSDSNSTEITTVISRSIERDSFLFGSRNVMIEVLFILEAITYHRVIVLRYPRTPAVNAT